MSASQSQQGKVQEVSPKYLAEASATARAVPEGYKLTEVGVIPEDWNISETDSFAVKVGSGKTPTGGATVYVDSGRPFIRSQNVGWGKLDLSDVAFITEETHATFTGSELHEDDVLLNITGASIGRCAKADNRIAGGNVNQHVCIIRADHKRMSSTLLVYLINSDLGQRQIDSYQAGGNREGLNFSQVRQLKFPISTECREQTAIANALSDVDALIAELEKLIAKKQAIKTATMQQLLTGRTRLPAFAHHPNGTPKAYKQTELGEIPEDWEVSSLGSLCSLKSGPGITSKDISDDSEYRCFGGNGLRGYTKSYTHEGEYVLIGRQGALCGNVQHVSGRFFASEHALVATPERAINSQWLSIYIDRMNLNQYSESSAQPGLSAEKLKVLSLITPLKDEQTAIATILSDMDTELQSLAQRLSKTRQIKQGMMQELLTGRKRLLKP